MRRRTITLLALLTACSLRPYTEGSATGEATSTSSATSTSGIPATSTTGSSPETTTTSTSTTTGGPAPDGFRGVYRIVELEHLKPESVFVDCATQQIWQLRSDDLPEACGEAFAEGGLYLHVAGVLHPDDDDPDALDELEVTEFLDGPCKVGSCEEPFEWSACGPWPDICGYYIGCDVWTQDCPEGQKCMPYSGDGDIALDSAKCVPVAPGAGAVGDPCTAEGGGVSGIDTCAEGHICWNLDPQANGTCVPQCTGSPDEPLCPDCMGYCTSSGDGVLTLCLPNCSPLLQDCLDYEVCIPNFDAFICVFDASGDEGQLFDPCEYANACDPGLWCAPPEYANECDPQALGCCLPFCDLNQPACPGVGQQCLPWSDQAPPCSANVGSCRLPP